MIERLQKYMANCGAGSRRKCEEFILLGRVKVNDVLIKELGYKIDNEKDIVYLDGHQLHPCEKKVYIMLNKPIGYVSTVKDEKGRKTIIDLIDTTERIYPIGRLDYETEGLILLTNDGDIYNKIIHPRSVINKVYIAKVKGIPTYNELIRFCSGLDIGDYITAPADLKIMSKNKESSICKVTIHEGKNRQIRRMCEKINHPVISLKRISIANLSLGNLKIGEYRYLTNKEVKYLQNL